jgi:hypothetical protein
MARRHFSPASYAFRFADTTTLPAGAASAPVSHEYILGLFVRGHNVVSPERLRVAPMSGRSPHFAGNPVFSCRCCYLLMLNNRTCVASSRSTITVAKRFKIS